MPDIGHRSSKKQNAVDLCEKYTKTCRSSDASATAGDSEQGNRGDARKQRRRTENMTGARRIQNKFATKTNKM
jgi:hypothetical protein